MSRPQLAPVRRIVHDARIKPANALADETRMSFPIPYLGDKGLRILFLFAPQRLDPSRGAVLFEPTYVAVFVAEDSVFEQLRLFETPEAVARGTGDSLGAFGMPEGVNRDQYDVLRERLWDRYDLLLPAFAGGETRVTSEEAAGASDFNTLFGILSEPPLRAYYHAVGQRFFDWVRSIESQRTPNW